MSDDNASMDDLYQEIILDHNKRPRNCKKLEDFTHTADGNNPLCGDEITVYLHIEKDRIIDISFTGQSCAIAKASASLMTEALKGKSIVEAHKEFEFIQDMFVGKTIPQLDELGDLAALAGVKKFPLRVKCATLAWHTMEAAIEGKSVSSTE